MVSKATVDCISWLNVCESVKWIDTIVADNKGTCRVTYFMSYNAKPHEVWDYERSDCSWLQETPDSKPVVGNFRNGVLDKSRLPNGLDLFYATHIYWIASERLRDAVLAADLTNFEFKRIPG